jgi:hypothetical protein
MPDLELAEASDLDLTKECPMSGGLGSAAFKLLAYIVWPDTPTRRNEYLATMGALAIGEMETMTPEDFGAVGRQAAATHDWEKLRKQVVADMFEKRIAPFGGISTVAMACGLEALSREIEKSQARTTAVGQLLYTIRCIAEHHPDARGGASVKKAVEIVTRMARDRPGAIKDRTRLMEAWKRSKTVAHLCAALVEGAAIGVKYGGSVRKEVEQGALFFSGLGRTLAVALDYQRFMTTFTPHGQSAPLVPASDAWLIPSQLTLREMSASTGRLSDVSSEILRTYRAPKMI